MSSQTSLPFPLPKHGDPLCCPLCGVLIPYCNYHGLFNIFTHVSEDEDGIENETEVLIHNDDNSCVVYNIEDLEHPLLKNVTILHSCRSE